MNSIFLIFYGRFPSEKAASLFAAKSCESFADTGMNVTLLVPRRVGRVKEVPFDYYGVHKNFKIVYLPTLDFLNLRIFQALAFQIGFLVFSVSCFLYLIFKAKRTDIIYSNESLPVLLSSFYFPNTLYEVHDFPEHKLWFYKVLFRMVRHILVTNIWKLKQLEQTFDVSRSKILCERNAVELKDFDISITKEEARKKLGLKVDGNIVVYTGHLYGWKGVDTLALATEKLPKDINVIFIGGTDADLARFRNTYGKIKNISIVGQREHSEMPLWQKAADVLVLPNTAKEDISKYHTSPMKLFEYMASRRPIVATDIPSVREILDDTNSVIVSPDDPQVMAKGIIEILGDNERAKKITEKAYQDVEYHTWDKRARRILDFVGA